MTDTPTIMDVARPDPKLIQELFDTDPLALKDQDIDLIILALRQERSDYLQPKEAKPAKAKAVRAPSPKDQPDLPLGDDISLGDLGLDL